MTTIRVVPALARQTIRDLSGRITARPSAPDHHSGACTAGYARFPESWTRELVARRADELLAGGPGTGWRSVTDRRILYRRYDDGLWLMVLTYSTAPATDDTDETLHVIGAFPHDSGPAIEAGPSEISPLYRSAFEQMRDAFDELHSERTDDFTRVAAWLWAGGLIAESLVWLILCLRSFPAQFDEDTWALLHALAVDGLFGECPRFDALGHIETEWARDYPATWGLPHETHGHPEPVLVEPAHLPGDDEAVRAARRWVEAALPRHLRSHPDTQVAANRGEADPVAITLTLPRGRASLVISGSRDDPGSGFGEITLLEDGAHPGDRLAGLILALAASEILGGDRGYIRFPEPFASVVHLPQILAAETSQLDLHRLVLLDVDTHRHP